MTLTDAKIRNLKPKDKQFKVADFNGLHVLVRPNGSKLWRFKYRIHGKEKLLAIGVYPAVSLLEAREVRDRARSQISNGDDPSQLKREKALADKEIHNQSFEKIAEAYLNKIDKEGRASATMVKNRWYMDMAIATFGRKPITEITSPVVLRCLTCAQAVVASLAD